MAYKHTFAENIAAINGDAVYGQDVREAIMEALSQAQDVVEQLAAEALAVVKENSNTKIQQLSASLNTKIQTFQLDIENDMNALTALLDAVRNLVENRELYVELHLIEGTDADYEMEVINAGQ